MGNNISCSKRIKKSKHVQRNGTRNSCICCYDRELQKQKRLSQDVQKMDMLVYELLNATPSLTNDYIYNHSIDPR